MLVLARLHNCFFLFAFLESRNQELAQVAAASAAHFNAVRLRQWLTTNPRKIANSRWDQPREEKWASRNFHWLRRKRSAKCLLSRRPSFCPRTSQDTSIWHWAERAPTWKRMIRSGMTRRFSFYRSCLLTRMRRSTRRASTGAPIVMSCAISRIWSARFASRSLIYRVCISGAI